MGSNLEIPTNALDSCRNRYPEPFRASAEQEPLSSDAFVIRRLGWNKVGDDVVYCTGDKILSHRKDAVYPISKELSDSYCRFPGADCTPKEAVETMLKFIKINPRISNFLFAACLLGCLRQCFVDAEVYPECAVYLVGPTQTRKTRTAQLGSRFIRWIDENCRDGAEPEQANCIRNASTGYAMAESVDKIKDVVFILDDLYRDQDGKIRRGMESAVTRMVRDSADHAARKSKNNAFKPNCQLLITAEYVLGNLTTQGRMLMLFVEYEPENGGNSPDDGNASCFYSERLREVQREKGRIPVFYENFLTWFSGRYCSAVEQICQGAVDRHVNKGVMTRVYEECWMLRTAFQFFLEYAESLDMGINSAGLLSEFDRNRQEILKAQSAFLRRQIQRSRKSRNTNYSKILVDLMTRGGLDEISDKDFYKHKENIRIRTAPLCNAISRFCGFGVSEKELTKYFRDRGISLTYTNGSNKRDKDGRLLELSEERLRKDAEDSWIDEYLI